MLLKVYRWRRIRSASGTTPCNIVRGQAALTAAEPRVVLMDKLCDRQNE